MKPFCIATLLLIVSVQGVLSRSLAQNLKTERCDELTSEAWHFFGQIAEASDARIAEMADVTLRARTCYEESGLERRLERRVWLLEYETHLRDQAEQFREAEALVDLFDRGYAGAITELGEQRAKYWGAKFAMHRFRFRYLAGDVWGADTAWDNGKADAVELPFDRRMRYHLNGALLHLEVGNVAEAHRIADEAIALVEVSASVDSSLLPLYGRAMLLRSEALLGKWIREDEIPDSLYQTVNDLYEIALYFEEAGQWNRLSVTYATLGRVYAFSKQAALAEDAFKRAVTIAKEREVPRSELFAYKQWGEFYLDHRELDNAQFYIEAAGAVAHASGIFDIELDLLKGEIEMARGRYAGAETIFQRVASMPAARYAPDAIRSRKARDKALSHLLTISTGRGEAGGWTWYVIVAAALLMVATICSIVISHRRQRPLLALSQQQVVLRASREGDIDVPLIKSDDF